MSKTVAARREVQPRVFLKSSLYGLVISNAPLGGRRIDGLEEAIEARGARVFYLPPYSPDFNPVVQLWKAIASFLKTVFKGECKAYLANSGYA